MSWKLYQLAFQLKSPLHIGWRKVGNLNQSRPYVPGKVVWAALTARLTRNGFISTDENFIRENAYERTGNLLKHYMAFSYLFPSLKKDATKVLMPKYESGQLKYGDKTESEFQYLVMDSYASTSLDYSMRSAEEGSLHETEFIRPTTRKDNGDVTNVYLVGYLVIKDGFQDQLTMDNLQKILNQIQLGGERRYGWGRVALIKCELKDEKIVFQDWQLEKNGESEPLKIKCRNDSYLPAHALATPDTHEIAGIETGAIEPLVGRETSAADGFGRNISKARICWTPGTRVKKGFSANIGEYGILFG